MTSTQAIQKFDFRWTVLSAAVVLVASVSLLQLSKSSGAFVGMAASGMAAAGFLARLLVSRDFDLKSLLLAQRLRMVIIAGFCIAAFFTQLRNQSAVTTIAAIMLWMAGLNAGLQIAGKYSLMPRSSLPYVQFVGDYWVALFLVFWGSDWMLIAGVLAFAASTSMVAVAERDRRLLALEALASAALLVLSVPVSVKAFGIYLFLVVFSSAWSANHLVTLALHLRSLTASASDV